MTWIGRAFQRIARVLFGDRPHEEAAASMPHEEKEPLASLPLSLGDVIVRRAERDEAWLAGAIVFEEQRPVAALFVAPEAGGDRALLVHAEASAPLVWLAPVADCAAARAGEPPHVLEIEGTRFERSRRLPLRTTRAGTGAPDVGATAILAEYAGPGAERAVVVAGSEATRVWRGVALGEGEYDVLPGGKGAA